MKNIKFKQHVATTLRRLTQKKWWFYYTQPEHFSVYFTALAPNWHPLTICIATPTPKFENDNLHDSQLLIKWDGSQFDPMAQHYMQSWRRSQHGHIISSFIFETNYVSTLRMFRSDDHWMLDHLLSKLSANYTSTLVRSILFFINHINCLANRMATREGIIPHLVLHDKSWRALQLTWNTTLNIVFHVICHYGNFSNDTS